MEDFYQHYSEQLNDIADLMIPAGIQLVIVGGVVRDFLSTGTFGKDVDIELVSSTLNNPEKVIDKVIHILQQCGITKIEELPFHIIRFKRDGYEFEFSIGRIEKFIEGNFSHKNFKAEFDLGDNFQKKWIRRDLSINAIGLNFHCQTIIDPFDGQKDLQKKILRPISDDFYRDPIRLLRLIRFKLQLGFSVSEVIEVKKFNLRDISYFHLFREGEKVGLSTFFKELNQLKDVEFNSDHCTLMHFSESCEFNDFDHLIWTTIKNKNEDCLGVIERGGLFSKKKIRKLNKFFAENDIEKKQELLGELKTLGGHFYEYAKKDMSSK